MPYKYYYEISVLYILERISLKWILSKFMLATESREIYQHLLGDT